MFGKFENLFNLALEVGQSLREKTENLDVGYTAGNANWELIVKYHSSLSGLEQYGIRVEPLIAGYGILSVPEEELLRVNSAEEIEYVEKPKNFYYEAFEPGNIPCIRAAKREPLGLSGEGVIIAILDSGLSYWREEFRRKNGATRVYAIWDQTIPGRPPEGFYSGTEFTYEEINEALKESNLQEMLRVVPSMDATGHGTAVAAIAAAGAIGGVSGTYEGVSPKAELLIVKLGTGERRGFPKTTEIMRGITYALKKAQERGLPLVINLSFGNTYGSHRGNSLLERFIDNAAEIGKTCICIGAGNEGSREGHYAGDLTHQGRAQISIGPQEQVCNLQLWKEYKDQAELFLETPNGEAIALTLPRSSDGGEAIGYELETEGEYLAVFAGVPTPYSTLQEIYIEWIPKGQYLTEGIWSLGWRPVHVTVGQLQMYLPSYRVRGEKTRFLTSTPEGTITIPATARRALSVGAIDSYTDSYASFSGRGFKRYGEQKPDIAAWGTDILVPQGELGYGEVSGTSFAAPVAAGAAALLMEWGIGRGNDAYLYGEKLKAYLERSARTVRGIYEYPNELVGYGSLCLENAL